MTANIQIFKLQYSLLMANYCKRRQNGVIALFGLFPVVTLHYQQRRLRVAGLPTHQKRPVTAGRALTDRF